MLVAWTMSISLAWGCNPEIPPSVPAGRPNIVVVVIDTLRADKLGVYGHALDTSPELDAWADRGVRFARPIAQSSWTRPSLGSMLTSQYPRTLGIYSEEDDVLPTGVDTLAELLQRAGYKTFGTTANPNLNRSFHFDQGFDRYLDSNVVWSWMESQPGNKQIGTHRVQSAREMFEPILEWVKEAGEGPFYLQTNIMEMHEWHDTRGRYENSDLFAGQGDRLYLQALRNVSKDVDWWIRTLSEQPGFERTLFVITSDHGEGLYDHPDVSDSNYHGRLLYESSQIVPLLLYSNARDLPAGRVVERPVRLLDLLPTLLDHAGVEIPEGLAGVSLMPLLADPPQQVRLPDAFFVETQFRGHDKLALYTRDWKYIENRDLHDGTSPTSLQKIGETENGRLTDRAAQRPEVAESLAAELAAWESAHPRAAPSTLEEELSADEREQLRALGYGD